MKRKITFILTTALVLCLAGCGKDKKDDNTQAGVPVVETSQEETSGEDTQTSGDDMYTESGAYYLANTMDWGEEKDLTGVTLFCDKLTIPITTEKLDEVCSPYVVSEWGGDSIDNINAANFDEIKAIDYSFSPGCGYINIGTQESYNPDSADSKWTYYNDEYNCNIKAIEISDTEESGITLNDAIDGGYWVLCRDDNISPALVLDETGDSTDDYIAFIKKFGKPSYLYFYDTSHIDTLNKNAEGSIAYFVVYEREDYAISMYVFEMINGGEHYNITLQYLKYHSAAEWEQYKQVEGINDSNIIRID